MLYGHLGKALQKHHGHQKDHALANCDVRGRTLYAGQADARAEPREPQLSLGVNQSYFVCFYIVFLIFLSVLCVSCFILFDADSIGSLS